MSDNDKAIVEHEMDREIINRALTVEENGFEEMWELFDELLRIFQTLKLHGELKDYKLGEYAGIDDDKIPDGLLLKCLASDYGLIELEQGQKTFVRLGEPLKGEDEDS